MFLAVPDWLVKQKLLLCTKFCEIFNNILTEVLGSYNQVPIQILSKSDRVYLRYHVSKGIHIYLDIDNT